jgi:hypothetical protein
MKRWSVVLGAAVLAFLAGAFAARIPAARADMGGVTSIGAVSESVESAGPAGVTFGTHLWLTRSGTVYRCYRTRSAGGEADPPFRCVKQTLTFD